MEFAVFTYNVVQKGTESSSQHLCEYAKSKFSLFFKDDLSPALFVCLKYQVTVKETRHFQRYVVTKLLA